MPGAPGSSLACAECRLRRKKCDLQRPHCIRCVRSNILCSGPGNDRTFVLTRVDGGKLRKQRQTLIDNIRENRGYNGNTTELLRSIKRQNELFHNTMSRNGGSSVLARNFRLSEAPFELVFLTVLGEFKEDKQIGIFTADRAPLTVNGQRQAYSPIALSIRALLKLATPTRHALNVAIYALLVLYLGRLTGSDEMLETARRAYGSVLDKTQAILSNLPEIERNSERQWTLMVCQIVALRLFELLDHIEPAHPSVIAHERAIVAIMNGLGPEAFVRVEIKRLLQGHRTFAVNNAIVKRHDSIFTQSAWIELLKNYDTWCPRQSLMDRASKIPNIIARADRLLKHLCEEDGHNYQREAYILLQQITAIHLEFEEWLTRYESLFVGPLFWSASAVNSGSHMHNDTECRPKDVSSSAQLNFHSAPVAGVLTAYAAYRMELWMLAEDLRKKMTTLDPGVEMAQTIAMDTLVETESGAAKKTAWLILEAMPFLSSCFEGGLVLQAPLATVERYYRKNEPVS